MSFTTREGDPLSLEEIREMVALKARQMNIKNSYIDYETYGSSPRIKVPARARNRETKYSEEVKVPAAPQLPSAKNSISHIKRQVLDMQASGYSDKDIHAMLDNVYSDYKETLEELKKKAPKCQFEVGDILKTQTSKHDFRYFRIAKLYYDPFQGWMGDIEYIMSKQGIPVATSTTTLRKMAKRGNNGYRGLVLNEHSKLAKVKGEEMPVLFSRHPYTNIFY